MIDLFKNRNYQPMLLKEIEKPFNSKEYYFEVKFDGERALLFVSCNSVIIKTRNNIDVTFKYPELQSIKNIVTKPTVFDGEIVAFDDGRPSFSKLSERAHLQDISKIKNQSITNPITFICFDILYLNKNLIDLPLQERKALLNKFPDTDVFIKNKYLLENGKELFQKVKKLNLEGIVAKKIDSPYLINERSNNWLKIKNLKREEFFIGGYQEKESNYVISLYLGEYIEKKLYFVGKVTLSKKNSLYQKVLHQEKQAASPFYDYRGDFIFLKPNLKCFVTYLERTKNNHLRQPIVK